MSVNMRSALLMIAAMALFAVEDALIKLLTGQITPGQVLVFIGVGSGGIFCLWIKAMGRPIWSRLCSLEIQSDGAVGLRLASAFWACF